jgi:hypothetical protein
MWLANSHDCPVWQTLEGAAAGSAKPKRGTLSAKARKAISDAQKARWAKQKAAAKK